MANNPGPTRRLSADHCCAASLTRRLGANITPLRLARGAWDAASPNPHGCRTRISTAACNSVVKHVPVIAGTRTHGCWLSSFPSLGTGRCFLEPRPGFVDERLGYLWRPAMASRRSSACASVIAGTQTQGGHGRPFRAWAGATHQFRGLTRRLCANIRVCRAARGPQVTSRRTQ